MLILAPMQGLTELLFRQVFQSVFPNAFDVAISPFLSLTHGNLKDTLKKIDDVLPDTNKESIPVIPQILGHDTLEFIELSNHLYDLGYTEVNWNIGCPMQRVAHKHRGSGILPYPNEVKKVLHAITPQLKPQLSIKMRLGYYNANEIFDLIPILNDFPLKNIILHPRTGKQLYLGTPDLETFGRTLPLWKHPIIYNGDICTVDDYINIHNRFPQIQDVMIGRGALYNPLLPWQIKEIECNNRKIKEFIETLLTAILSRPMSDTAKIRKIKEYWCMLYRSLNINEDQRNQVLHTRTLSDAVTTLRQIL